MVQLALITQHFYHTFAHLIANGQYIQIIQTQRSEMNLATQFQHDSKYQINEFPKRL